VIDNIGDNKNLVLTAPGWDAKIRHNLTTLFAVAWAIFQLYATSDIPFALSEFSGLNLVLTSQESREFHLAFALALAATACPWRWSISSKICSGFDVFLVIAGPATCLYLFLQKDSIATRAGLPTDLDLLVSVLGLLCLAIAVFRTLGLPLLIVAAVFLFYVFFGSSENLPDVMQWKGASFGKAMWHFWMQTEGVFGIALGVSTSMIFLFVLFGALLEKAGAGKYFIALAFSLLGHHRGGPAKAAVVASALSGVYSGSSIANVVTTGTFTIPLMKKTGLSAEKAGAIEVASSTNGQLMPPVMGAAAFLIAEFTGVAYTDLLLHALLPAVISYIALFYIVHLESLKLGLVGMLKQPVAGSSFKRTVRFVALLFLGTIAGAALKLCFDVAGNNDVLSPIWLAGCLFVVTYLFLVRIAAQATPVDIFELSENQKPLPPFGDVVVTGLHFILPVFVLIWCVLVERLSPSYSAFWATLSMLFICFTQPLFLKIFTGGNVSANDLKLGFSDVMSGMAAGSISMIPIAIATGIAGIIVGTVSLTGAHQMVGELVEYLSGGNLMLMLILVAIMCLILGMGLPTTANYIVVSSLMAPVIVSVGMQSGLVVPLVAVHLYVFYFGILADDTPPVGLAAYAAAAISGGDPIRTGVQGFSYDMRTALLPFIFIYNTELLLMDVSIMRGIFVFITSTIAMMLFASAIQGFFLVRNKIWESVLMLVLAFAMFRPGFFWDFIEPKFDFVPGTEVQQYVDGDGSVALNLVISGADFADGSRREITILRDILKFGDLPNVFQSQGMRINVSDGQARIEENLGGRPDTALRDFDFFSETPVLLEYIRVERDRPGKDSVIFAALLLLLVLVWTQSRRRNSLNVDGQTAKNQTLKTTGSEG